MGELIEFIMALLRGDREIREGSLLGESEGSKRDKRVIAGAGVVVIAVVGAVVWWVGI